jgi:hypothetical protein
MQDETRVFVNDRSDYGQKWEQHPERFIADPWKSGAFDYCAFLSTQTSAATLFELKRSSSDYLDIKVEQVSENKWQFAIRPKNGAVEKLMENAATTIHSLALDFNEQTDPHLQFNFFPQKVAN